MKKIKLRGIKKEIMFRDTRFLSCLTPMVIPIPGRLQNFLLYVAGVSLFLEMRPFLKNFSLLFNSCWGTILKESDTEGQILPIQNLKIVGKCLSLWTHAHTHTHSHKDTHTEENPERF